MAETDKSLSPLVLVVEDEAELQWVIYLLLQQEGLRVAAAEDCRAGAAMLETLRPDILLAEMRLVKGRNGDRLSRAASRTGTPTLLIRGGREIITCHRDQRSASVSTTPFTVAGLRREVRVLIPSLNGAPQEC